MLKALKDFLSTFSPFASGEVLRKQAQDMIDATNAAINASSPEEQRDIVERLVAEQSKRNEENPS